MESVYLKNEIFAKLMNLSSSCEKSSSVLEDSCPDDSGMGKEEFVFSGVYTTISALPAMLKIVFLAKIQAGTKQDAP